MIDFMQGSLILTTAALAVQWKLTGVSPVRQASRGIDLLRAIGYLGARMVAECREVARRDWETCVAKARRER